MARAFGCKILDPRVIVFWGLCSISLPGWSGEVPAGILAGLSSGKFAEREEAQGKLRDWAKARPAAALPALREQAAGAEDPEIQARCLSVLKEVVLEKEFPGEGYLGISMLEMTLQVPGDMAPRRVIRIGMVLPGSAAENAGLIANDLIVGLNDRVWREEGMSSEFARRIQETRPGSEVALVVLRGEKISRLQVKVGLKPEEAGEEGAAAAKAARDRFFERWLNKQDPAGR